MRLLWHPAFMDEFMKFAEIYGSLTPEQRRVAVGSMEAHALAAGDIPPVQAHIRILGKEREDKVLTLSNFDDKQVLMDAILSAWKRKDIQEDIQLVGLWFRNEASS